jgi:pilus assembly protein Flp/PilA
MLEYMQKALAAFRREEGQALVEYALILSLVSIGSIAMLTVLGVDIGEIFTTVETALDGVAGG